MLYDEDCQKRLSSVAWNPSTVRYLVSSGQPSISRCKAREPNVRTIFRGAFSRKRAAQNSTVGGIATCCQLAKRAIEALDVEHQDELRPAAVLHCLVDRANPNGHVSWVNVDSVF